MQQRRQRAARTSSISTAATLRGTTTAQDNRSGKMFATWLRLLSVAVLLAVIASRASPGGCVAEALALLSTSADNIHRRMDDVSGVVEDNDNDIGDVANLIVDEGIGNNWPPSSSWQITERRQRRGPAQQSPLDAVSWLNLRRFVCGSEANVRCLTDERYGRDRCAS